MFAMSTYANAGSNVMLYFFKWVESEKGGKGGNKWVADHIETFVNIAGASLRRVTLVATIATHTHSSLHPLNATTTTTQARCWA
jgi:hypothetical protein